MATMIRDFDSPAEVLAAARSRRAAADRAEADQLQLATEWAAMHSVDSVLDAPGHGSYGDAAIAIAGPGAPLVAEFAVAELAAALGLSTDAGRGYLGEAVELRYRLPRVWRRVVDGGLAAWKARRIASATIALSREAAGFVDTHVSHVAHRIGPFQLARLVEEAITRCMPGEAEKRRRAAAEGRHFTIETRDTSLAGTAAVWGELDLADALDLDAAVAAGAAQLRALGSTDSLDVRRAAAIGELARHQQTLDLNTDLTTATDTDTATATAAGAGPRRMARQVVLYVHLADAAVATGAVDGPGDQLGRLENTRNLITAEQVRRWCANPDTQVIVKPVLDLADHVHVSQYEVPDRMAEAAVLLDVTCVFPFCTRAARGCRGDEHDADCDHITAYGPGAPTCSCNVAPLCRRHHRLKTHGGWRYTQVERGTYLWASPLGLSFVRDHDGTLDVTRERPSGPVRACGHPPDS